jgi:2-C-methyl-D-erythritol 4-phosphate cytidylyltransferase
VTRPHLNIAIIPAAGIGSRMNADRAKQLIEVGGIPVLIHTLRRFEECDLVDQVILVLQPDLTTEAFGLISRFGIRKVSRVVAGGAQRQDSVYRGLQVVSPDNAGVILIHDAVRPFVAPDLITSVTERAETAGAAILAIHATDTIKQVKSGRIVRTLDRRQIFQAQTPQAFRYKVIKDAFDRALSDGFVATDDSQLVERLKQRVSVVEGSPLNIKITRPWDLKVAELIYQEHFASKAQGQ